MSKASIAPEDASAKMKLNARGYFPTMTDMSEAIVITALTTATPMYAMLESGRSAKPLSIQFFITPMTLSFSIDTLPTLGIK